MTWLGIYLVIGLLYAAPVVIGDWRAAHDIKFTAMQAGFYALLWPLSVAFVIFRHTVMLGFRVLERIER